MIKKYINQKIVYSILFALACATYQANCMFQHASKNLAKACYSTVKKGTFFKKFTKTFDSWFLNLKFTTESMTLIKENTNELNELKNAISPLENERDARLNRVEKLKKTIKNLEEQAELIDQDINNKKIESDNLRNKAKELIENAHPHNKIKSWIKKRLNSIYNILDDFSEDTSKQYEV
ncbi:hypothetical protein KAH94_03560 [bacterium]|nr:hypothetical protein [bacterium]